MTELIGHFHPLLVHLPIGILILALFISLLPESKRAGMQSAFSLSLAVAAISSALACVAGYLLSKSGDYDTELVEKHQWSGISTCILTFIAWLAPKFNRQILWCTVAILALASHLGGTITHGEGYLFSLPGKEVAVSTITDTLAETAVKPVPDTLAVETIARQKVFLYRDEVTPILKSKCYNCHSAVKKKGGLRLDAESFINKGGKNGEILVKGDPNKSPLYTNLLLPLGDEKHMPPKGKKQLTRAEMAIIHRWIQSGAPFGAIEFNTAESSITKGSATALEQGDPGDAPPRDLRNANPIPAAFSEISSEKSGKPAGSVHRKEPILTPANKATIISLQEKGIIVENISAESNRLSVNFVNVKAIDDGTLNNLNEMLEQVTILKFTGQSLTNDMLKILAPFPNLERLQLEKTHITDEGLIELKKFRNLEILNLYGTNISDNGLDKLELVSLKKINLWNTKVSEQGIKTLIAKNPGLEVEAGQLSLKKPDSTRKN